MSEHETSRRRFLRHATYIAATLAGAPGCRSLAGRDAAERTRPNILVVLSDQQHWQAIGTVDPFFDTPRLDALASESAVFEHSFCTSPQCCPSRSSLMTGFYPTTTGVIANIGDTPASQPLRQQTLAPRLQALGYRTGYFGKWHLGDEEIATRGWDLSRFDITDASIEMNARTFLEHATRSTQPFALFVSFNNPHDIYQYRGDNVIPSGLAVPLPRSWHRETFAGKPPVQQQFMREDGGRAIRRDDRRAWERYRAFYRDKTRLFDDSCGAMLDALRRHGLWESTVVVFSSDHGDMDTNHRLILKGPFMYEHVVRVPLMIRVPTRFMGTPGQCVTGMDVVNVDIAPTILDFCGHAPMDSDGISLRPVLTGQRSQASRDYVIGQYYAKQRWVNPIRMIRTREFKLNRHIRHGDELYDLRSDPDELRNLADEPRYADVKTHLARLLESWIEEHADPFFSLRATTRAGAPLG